MPGTERRIGDDKQSNRSTPEVHAGSDSWESGCLRPLYVHVYKAYNVDNWMKGLTLPFLGTSRENRVKFISSPGTDAL